MTDTQTMYEFRLACYKPGCPICTLVQRVGTRYIEGTFTESMLDPVVRQRLVVSLGFCYEHTWQSITLKLSDALGHAILYQDLVNDVMKKIGEGEKITGYQVVSALNPVAPCPACQVEEGALGRIIDSMAHALRDKDFIAEFKQSSGLCIPHLRRLLPSLDGEMQEIVLGHQLTCMESLKGELAEFIRKSDYRFRDEAYGKEGDSYKRAAEMIMGKQKPAEKKDIL
jgi:hypothetical protein